MIITKSWKNTGLGISANIRECYIDKFNESVKYIFSGQLILVKFLFL